MNHTATEQIDDDILLAVSHDVSFYSTQEGDQCLPIEVLMRDWLAPHPHILAFEFFGFKSSIGGELIPTLPVAWSWNGNGLVKISGSKLPAKLLDHLFDLDVPSIVTGLEDLSDEHASILVGAGWHVVNSGYDTQIYLLDEDAHNANMSASRYCRLHNPFSHCATAHVLADSEHSKFLGLQRLHKATPAIAAWAARSGNLERYFPAARFDMSFSE
jgi:hypothetical protein